MPSRKQVSTKTVFGDNVGRRSEVPFRRTLDRSPHTLRQDHNQILIPSGSLRWHKPQFADEAGGIFSWSWENRSYSSSLACCQKRLDECKRHYRPA